MSDDHRPLIGTAPTGDDLDQTQWAQEAIRTGGAALQDSLRQLVTLTTALLAGSAAFFGQLSAPRPFKVFGVSLLLAALATAFVGTLPREVSVCPYLPDEIRAVRSKATARRLRLLKASGCCLIGAFLALLLGLWIG